MKQRYIKPLTDLQSMHVEDALAQSFDYTPRSYSWNTDEFFTQHGGAANYHDDPGVGIGFRDGDGDGISGDDMFAKGMAFSVWDD
ncbi:MAG: hypothetical protein IJK46_11350 [Prevotella sp.]|nr:hypothetical protein [Prevotella sp.]